MDNINSKLICRLREVEKRFERNASPVLFSISLNLYSGQVLGVRGENGAGKSTLLSAIAGVCRITGGSIEYAEGIKKSISYLPQELSLYDDLSGNANLNFYGIASGTPLKELKPQRERLLKELNLTDKSKIKVEKYSGGMKRRLHLATALMRTPKLLLLDEPTVGADRESVESILLMIEHFKARGTSIILVTHSDEELYRVSDRIINIKKGNIISDERIDN